VSTRTAMRGMRSLTFQRCARLFMARTATWPIQFRIIYGISFIALGLRCLAFSDTTRGGINGRRFCYEDRHYACTRKYYYLFKRRRG
jgi:hypothetical protein